MAPLNATNETRVTFSSEYTLLTTAIMALIFAVSIIGNSLIIAVVAKNVNMKTTVNLFVVNMAASDLLTTVLFIPLQMTSILLGRWPFQQSSIAGLLLCKVALTTAILSSGVSVASFVAISLDRFWAVFFPTKRPLSTRRPFVTLTVIWVICGALAFPYLIVRRVLDQGGSVVCLTDEESDFPVLPLWLHSIFHVGLPTLLIVILYPAILIRLWTRKLPGNPCAANQEIRDRTNRKVTCMAVTLILAFVISWFPFLGGIVIKERTTRFNILSSVFTYTSCIWNPLIYTTFNNNFRSGCKDLLRKFFSSCCITGNNCFKKNHIGNFSTHATQPTIELADVQVIGMAELDS